MSCVKRTWAEIDTDALIHNFDIIKEKCRDSMICAVVKADCYGHGTHIVAPVLDKCGADYFAVSNIDEALELRNCGIKKPVLILGYTPADCVDKLSEFDISQTVYSKEYGEMLSNAAKKINKKIKIHIKLDTGMGRIGFACKNEQFDPNPVLQVLGCENLLYEGIFTHFSVADSNAPDDKEYTDAQYRNFTNAIEKIESSGFIAKIHHCCNSAGLMLQPDKHKDMCRAGIMMYGLTPNTELNTDFNISPVMTFKTVISHIKSVNSGDSISYGRTYTADKDITVATLPVGYADGYPRLLSNCGYVLINGKKARILGKVCMDQVMVDVSGIENIHIGDEVELFGKNLSVDILASLCNTVNYEIICGISKRVPRIEK